MLLVRHAARFATYAYRNATAWAARTGVAIAATPRTTVATAAAPGGLLVLRCGRTVYHANVCRVTATHVYCTCVRGVGRAGYVACLRVSRTTGRGGFAYVTPAGLATHNGGLVAVRGYAPHVATTV